MSGEARFDPRASAEVEEGAVWYDERRTGLGREFIAEVRAAVRTVANSPGIGSLIDVADRTLEMRRVAIRRFPYQAVYVVHGGEVVVIAVAHDRRRTGYWAQPVDAPE